MSRNIAKIGNVIIGGNNPVVIQSMTNSNTEEVEETFNQIRDLYHAGSEMVRITVNTDLAARSVVEIKNKMIQHNIDIPLIGCFHYNGHILLQNDDCAQALDKYRINPGNIGGKKENKNYNMNYIIERAIQYNKAVRIGVNWGSLDQHLLLELMDQNNKSPQPKTSQEILHDALIQSAIENANYAHEIGLSKEKIVISCKVSKVNDLVNLYKKLAKMTDYALHVGLTEAGMGLKGIVSTTSALSILLNEGIGNTIRASLTPEAGGDRTEEVKLCKQILQSLAIKKFKPEVTACPGCGRTSNTYFQKLTKEIEDFINDNMPIWQLKYPKVVDLNFAVMGCIVNGPGESKHADIGISLPGNGENPAMPVFIDGKKKYTLRGNNISSKFKEIIIEYIENKYS